MGTNRDNPIKNNPVRKHMEEFNRPDTVEPKVNYKRKCKKLRPVHEIDLEDPYLDESDIGYE